MGWREGRLELRLVRGRGLYDGREAEYEECVGYAGYNNLAGIFISIFPRLLKSSRVRAWYNSCGTNLSSEIAQCNYKIEHYLTFIWTRYKC